MERNFSVTLRNTADGTFMLDILENETGESVTIPMYDPCEHPMFDAAVGAEFASWAAMMLDQMEEEEE